MELVAATDSELNFLLAARIARLATVDSSGRPHAVPVCFALALGRIYSPLDEKPKRVADQRLRRVLNIAANSSVCLVVDRYSENWDDLAWLQVRGKARVIEAGGENHAAALAALRLRYPQYQKMKLESRLVVEIQPDSIVSWQVNR